MAANRRYSPRRILCYLFSAYTTTSYKWGFYGYGTIAYLVLAWQTTVPALASARRVMVARDYMILTGWLNTIWVLYPIVFAVTDGGNVLDVTQEFIWTGIIDTLSLPVLACLVLFFARHWDFGLMNLHFTQYGRIARSADVSGKAPVPGPAATSPVASDATSAV